MSYLTAILVRCWDIKKIALVLFLLSPTLLVFLLLLKREGVWKGAVSSEAYFGKYRMGNVSYLRGEVTNVKRGERIVTVRTLGDTLFDVFVPKDASYFFKLTPKKGGEVKGMPGDNLSKVSRGSLVSIELSNDVFARRILVYDLQGFNY